MLDIFIAVALALLSLSSNCMGVHLTLRPQTQTGEWQWKYRAGFLVIGVFSVLVIGVQAWRGYAAGEELKATLAGQGQEIKSIKTDSDRPIQINIPRSAIAPKTQPHTEDTAAHKAEMKIKATQLSAEILSFLSERSRSGMSVFRLNDVLKAPGGPEERKRAIDEETKRYEDRQMSMSIMEVAP